MDFSERYRHSNGLVAFSPDGSMIANVIGSRLVVRSARELSVLRTWHIIPPGNNSPENEVPSSKLRPPLPQCDVHAILWCPKSQKIALASYSTSVSRTHTATKGIHQTLVRKTSGSRTPASSEDWVIVRSIVDGHEDYLCELQDGSAGLSRLMWTPEADALLAWSDWRTRITVWKLDESIPVIILAVLPNHSGLSFHNRLAAILHRKDSKDSIAIYDTVTWERQLQLELPTKEAAGVIWAPSGSCFAVWEGAYEFAFYIYACDGTMVLSIPAENDCLGIASIAWSPLGDLAIGSYDQKVRLVCRDSLQLGPEVANRLPLDRQVAIYQDPAIASKDHIGDIVPFERASHINGYSMTKSEMRNGHHGLGISMLAFSCDGRYLSSVEDSMPSSLWIWKVGTGTLELIAVLLHQLPLKMLQWSPTEPSLLLASTGPAFMTLWSGEERHPELIRIPFRDFALSQSQWRRDGQALLLQDKEVFSCAFLGLQSEDKDAVRDDASDTTTVVR